METPARSAFEHPPRRRVVIGSLIAAAFLSLGASASPAPGQVSSPRSTGLPLPALERHAEAMREGLAALGSGDGEVARERLSSFSFGSRPIEQARLFWLALAQEMNRETRAARTTLARLRARGARLAARDDALMRLAAMYDEAGYWAEAAEVFGDVRAEARAAESSRRAAVGEITARLALGDPGAVLARTRSFAASHPSDTRAAESLRVAQAITGANSPLDALTPSLRIERATRLARSGGASLALTELDALEATRASRPSRLEISLARAIALQKAGRHNESDRLIVAEHFEHATLRLPALETASANALASLAATDAASWKSWTVREKIGTRRVRVKGRWVTRTVYRNAPRKARRTDAGTRRQLAAARAAATVALERLLAEQSDVASRQASLRALASIARDADDRDAFEKRISDLVAIDAREDHLLQETWNEGWAAWRARKIPLARERFGMIQRAYAIPVGRRQARYWYARCLERSGEAAEAKRLFDELASAPLDDVYATFARKRGGTRGDRSNASVTAPLPDSPPSELALAWELVRVGLSAEARAEVRAAHHAGNNRWAYAILAESYARDGEQLLMANALRRGYPEIGTVDDVLVPESLRRMYYASPHGELLVRAAKANGVDPSLVKGLVLQESSGDALAGSRAGATGLMQLMPSTANEVSRKAGIAFHASRLTDPEYNVELGTRYLRDLLGVMKGDEILALASYNAGIGNVQRWLRASRGVPTDEFLENIPYSETRGYVKRVLYYRSVYGEGDWAR